MTKDLELDMRDGAARYVDQQLKIMRDYGMSQELATSKRAGLIEEIVKAVRPYYERRDTGKPLAQGRGPATAAGKTE